MTKQQLFTKVAKYLLKQKSKALDVNGDCVLVTANNKKRCAVGSLLSPAQWRKALSIPRGDVYGNIDDLISSIERLNRVELQSACRGTQVEMLLKLQSTHDYVNVNKWPEALSKIATRYHCKMPSVQG